MAGGTPTGIDLLERQLWQPAVSEGVARVVVGTAPPASGWRDEEVYWAVPSLSRVRLLVPTGNARLTSASLRNYRGLRAPRERWSRSLLGLWARAGGPPGAGRVRLQVRVGADEAAGASLPLPVVARALGQPRLFASIGVRPGANGKPTLQLIDSDGRPAGYAKLGWTPHTDTFVATESATLAALDGGSSSIGVPRLLATGTLHGHPWLVSAPLPGAARALTDAAEVVSAEELVTICPIIGSGAPAVTGHWRRLADRAHTAAGPDELVATFRRLVSAVSDLGVELPIAQRWHGDLTPWNCARDQAGRLWAWDWENSEEDVVAGLDAVHWAFSVRRRHTPVDRIDLRACVHDAAPTLDGLGIPPAHRPAVAAVYAAVLADRALGLAAVAGWERSWIAPDQVTRLVRLGQAQLDQAS